VVADEKTPNIAFGTSKSFAIVEVYLLDANDANRKFSFIKTRHKKCTAQVKNLHIYTLDDMMTMMTETPTTKKKCNAYT